MHRIFSNTHDCEDIWERESVAIFGNLRMTRTVTKMVAEIDVASQK